MKKDFNKWHKENQRTAGHADGGSQTPFTRTPDIAEHIPASVRHGRAFPRRSSEASRSEHPMNQAASVVQLSVRQIQTVFAYLLDVLKQEGKKVLVASTRGHIAKELLDRAKYIDVRKLWRYAAIIKGPDEPAPEVR